MAICKEETAETVKIMNSHSYDTRRGLYVSFICPIFTTII